jgi:hypothetical protein
VKRRSGTRGVAGSDEEGTTVSVVLKSDGKNNVCPNRGCGDGCFGNVDDDEDLDDSIGEETSSDCCGEGVARFGVDGDDEVGDDEGHRFAGKMALRVTLPGMTMAVNVDTTC